MTDKLKNQIKKYLDKTYYVKEGRILRKCDDVHEWGGYLAEWLGSVFSTKPHECCDVVSEWFRNQDGVTQEDINTYWSAKKLKYQLSLEMTNDLERLGVSNVEGQMINLVIDELSKEIDTTILKQLKPQIKTFDELLSLIKCIGYEKSKEPIYQPITFVPVDYFITTKYHIMLNERQSNHIWQNHFRPTRVDEQTQVTS